MELFYHLWGEPNENSVQQERKKIVLLHGMGGTGSLWRPIAAALENDITLLSLDQRGHGKSRVPIALDSRKAPSYTPLDYGRDVIETLRKLQFSPTWILGHSMGVRTAMAAAHLQPEWFQGIILIDLGFSGVAGGGLGENLALFIRQLPLEFSSRTEARTFMNEKCPDPSIAQYLMAVSTTNSEGRIIFPFDHGALIQTIHAARDVSVQGWVRELGLRNTPVFVLRGAKSLVWSAEEFQQEKAAFADLPSIEFIEFPNAGHGLPFEQRPAFVEFLRNKIL